MYMKTTNRGLLSCHILKFRFWIIQTKSDREMTETKIVDLDELYKYYVDDFFTRNKKCHFFLNLNFWIVQTNS
jgi:hypothetical protein